MEESYLLYIQVKKVLVKKAMCCIISTIRHSEKTNHIKLFTKTVTSHQLLLGRKDKQPEHRGF